MTERDLQHGHTFGQERVARGERRTLVVALATATFMVVEIVVGLTSGSMALLADGLHMGSHAVALGIAVAAYVYARRLASDERFSFGTGKVNALGGFTGALLLAVFAVFMAYESVVRLARPVEIAFDLAILVAVLGLLINGVSALLLGARDSGAEHADDGHAEHDARGDPQTDAYGGAQGHAHSHLHQPAGEPSSPAAPERVPRHDHNLRSAYLHVLADAVTSLAAIVALLGGKYLGLNWLDPVMGIAGALLVARWSWRLLRDASRVLLDHQAPEDVRERVRSALEGDGVDRVTDLHVWEIGPGMHAACITLISADPQEPGHYKQRLPAEARLMHTTVEVHRAGH